VQAATRVNAEQASKRTMCRPTRRPVRRRLIRLGEMSEDYARPLHRGIGGSMYTSKEGARNTESPCARSGMINRTPANIERTASVELPTRTNKQISASQNVLTEASKRRRTTPSFAQPVSRSLNGTPNVRLIRLPQKNFTHGRPPDLRQSARIIGSECRL
jgi:hypothetical protein